MASIEIIIFKLSPLIIICRVIALQSETKSNSTTSESLLPLMCFHVYKIGYLKFPVGQHILMHLEHLELNE